MENMKDIVDKEDISKELKGKGFKEIYAIEGNPSLIESQYVEDKILVEGVLSLNIYYLQDGNLEITTLKEEIPFKSYINADELNKDILIDVDTSLEELDYTLNDNTLVVNGTVKNHVFINRERKINIISEIEETEEVVDKRNRPSITIYMVQKEDILWDIAKRYNTTVEEIVLSNNITSPSTLMPGEKIIIEKKIDVDF